MRIELAKLLLRRPDVLLLDEPTNHLDIESIQWLENFIATRANAVILVSHDRAFIDNTTSRTIEIELGSIYDYKVKYSEYVELLVRNVANNNSVLSKTSRRNWLIPKHSLNDSVIKRPNLFRYSHASNSWKKVERIEVDEVDTAMLSLKFPPAPRSVLTL